VLTHLGPPSCRRQTSASYARSQVLFWRLLHRRQQDTDPRFMAKSPITRRTLVFRLDSPRPILAAHVSGVVC